MDNGLNLFVTDAYGNGGISSNFLVLSKNLSDSYMVIFRTIGKTGKQDRTVISYMSVLSLVRGKEFNSVNLFVCSPRGLLFLFSFFIAKFFFFRNIKIKPIFIAYHPGEFSGTDVFSIFYRKLILTLPLENIWFMNSSCYLKHNLVCSQRLKPNYLNLVFDSHNRSLPISGRVNASKLDMKKMKIVLTIGRLVGFKMNGILSLVEYAKRSNVYLIIIGDGPGREIVLEALGGLDVCKYEYLPFVPLEYLYKYYLRADIYFGMGTTLLEAASFNIPSIVSIAGGPSNYCYGWFSDQSDYNVGESNKDQLMYDLSLFLDNALGLEGRDLSRVLEKQGEHLQNFNTNNTMSRFGRDILRAQYFNQSIFLSLFKICTMLIFSLLGVIFFKLFKYNRYDRI